MDNSTPDNNLPSQDGQDGQAQAASSQPTPNNGSTNATRQLRPARLLEGYQEVTLTHGSPLRPTLTICPICLLDITSAHETLTHTNGTCNRSFHQDCWEAWIADMGTCVNCQRRLQSDVWGIAIQATDPGFHQRNGFQNLMYRANHHPQDLVGQESLEYHVTWVLSHNNQRLIRQYSITDVPSPFCETDLLRLWFARRRAEFNIFGVASRWQDLVQYGGPQNTQTQLIIAQFQDIRRAFNRLVSILPHVYDIYRLHGNLTRAVFNPSEFGMSTWEEEVAPWIRDETRNEVAGAIRRWTLAFDQAVHSEEWLDQEQEQLPMWERLVNRLDGRRNRQWRRGM